MDALASMVSLVKTEEKNLSLVGKDLFLTTIRLYWFFICVILISITFKIRMDGITFTVVQIMAHYDNTCVGDRLIQVAKHD